MGQSVEWRQRPILTSFMSGRRVSSGSLSFLFLSLSIYKCSVCLRQPRHHVHGFYMHTHTDKNTAKYRMPRQQTATTTSHHHTPVAPAAVAKATRPSCPTLQRKVMGKWKYSLRSRGFPPQGCAHYGCLVSPFPSLAMFRVVLSFTLVFERRRDSVSFLQNQSGSGWQRALSISSDLPAAREKERKWSKGGRGLQLLL